MKNSPDEWMENPECVAGFLPQTEHQAPGFSALGESSQPVVEYQWVAEGDGFTLYRIGHGSRQSCGRLNTGASVSTHKLATLYNSAATLLRQRDELWNALTKIAPILDNDGPLVAAYADCRPIVDAAIASCEKENAADLKIYDGPSAGQCNDILGKPGHYR